mgnify:FL=1
MKEVLLTGFLLCFSCHTHSESTPDYQHRADFITPPPGQKTIGDGHGDIAVSANGDIYISVQGGAKPRVQIYTADGSYKGNLEGAASDFHGFRIHRDTDGVEYLYGTELEGERLVKWSLDGELVLAINIDDEVPSNLQKRRRLLKGVRVTGVAISRDDRIFVTDGYATSLIHEFDQQGNYLTSLGGKNAPWNFSTAQKIIIDGRNDSENLLVTDRENNRLVWLDFKGNIVATHDGLRRPSALSIHNNLLAIAELHGRVTVLDATNKIVAELGTNDNRKQISTPKVRPKDWEIGKVTSPHGISFDNDGNILVTEWNKWGRVLKFKR